MESTISELLRSSKRHLEASDLDLKQLVRYLKGRKLITAKSLQTALTMNKQEMMDMVFQDLQRKETKGWLAIRDWLVRNAPANLYQKIVHEDPPVSKKKLLPEFDLEDNQTEQKKESTTELPNLSEPTAMESEAEIKIGCEDTSSDPWGDCSDEKLIQFLTEVENQQTLPMEDVDPTEMANDVYLYELWAEILNDNLSFGDVLNNRQRCKLNLGKNIFVTAGMWKGEMKIHLRRYDPTNSFATEKGLVFSIDLWKKLSKMIDIIDVNYERVQKMNASDVNMEVGEKIFVGMEMGSPKIDVRLWWQPPGCRSLKRTTKGVKLNPWQWDKLKAIFKYMSAFVPELGVNE
jgi:hypothetical protein